MQDAYKEVRVRARKMAIPTHWELKTLSNCCEICYGKRQDDVENEEGEYPVIGTGGRIGFADDYLYNKPSVLIGRKGTIDKPQFLDKPFWAIDTIFYTKVNNNTHPRWLYYYLDHYDLTLLNEATGVPSLNRNNLYNLGLPLPPLPEQKKIATILSTVDKALEKTTHIIDKTKRLKKGLMQRLLTKGIGHDEFKECKLGVQKIQLPSNWKIKQLGDLAYFKNGLNFSKKQKGNKGLLTVDVLNMYSEDIYIDTSNLYKVDVDIEDKKKYLLEKGDILFVRSSLKQEGVGWASLYKEQNEPVAFCGFIIRCRIKNSIDIDPKFLTYFLRTDYARNTLVAGSGRVGITNVSQKTLKILDIPIPPLPEQKQIASILTSVDNKIQKEQEYKERLQQLKKGLMQQLLTGRRRVQV